MHKLSRNFALKCYSINKISSLSENEIKDRLCADYLDDNGDSIEYSDLYSDEVQNFLINFYCEKIFAGVSNEFLEKFIKDCFKENYTVIGKEKEFFKCHCCGYLTLESRGEYDVCPVCFWEDDGKSEASQDNYSYANASTLRNYRESKLKEINTNIIPFKKGYENSQ
ncbi:CPCC family cysteine-rich protein [Lysinibacillus sp. NPDC056185]|uniref:CPCC family cysteine-rich protein n=1 Tax=Lysinibacillus sp. NPDC056185 TaxID=3345739 RepID=UPI0039EE6E13